MRPPAGPRQAGLATGLAGAGRHDIRRRMTMVGDAVDYTPLSHLRRGMTIRSRSDGGLVGGPSLVELVEYRGRSTTSRSTRPTPTAARTGSRARRRCRPVGAQLDLCLRGADMRNLRVREHLPRRHHRRVGAEPARPRPSSTPPTPSSPTTPPASPRTCGPTRAGRTHRPLPGRRRGRGRSGSRTRSARCTTDVRRAVVRPRRLLPDQRPEPRARGSSCALASRTGSSAACASTTGVRSRTPWPTSRRW